MYKRISLTKTDRRWIGLMICLCVIQFLWLIDLPFFWDAKSKALRASWIYEHHFSSLIVPTQLNSGHPPLWIASLAFFWSLFGKSLWAARLLLMLVNIGVGYQLYLLFLRLKSVSVPRWTYLLLLIEPTFLAQSTSLNNDMLLLFFALMAINTLLTYQWKWYALALTGLLFTNLRGIYFALALIILHVLIARSHSMQGYKRMIGAYMIAIGVASVFFLYQYWTLGWAIISENKGYSQHRRTVDMAHLVKNNLVYIKSFLEFGRWLLYIPILWHIISKFRIKTAISSDSYRRIWLLVIVIAVILFLGTVPFSNPISPRYFMLCYLLLTLLSLNIIFDELQKKIFVVLLIAASFVSGHWWIYPPKLAQAWDSTLAYLNYYPLEEEMLKFMKEEAIPQAATGTHLPLMNYHFNFEDVAEIPYEFVNVDFHKNRYILFSNLENASTDEQIDELRDRWVEIKSFDRGGIYLKLYQKP